MNSFKSRVFATIAAFAAFAVVPAAQAVPMLQLSDGTTTVTITDQGAGDTDAHLGSIVYYGAVGSFIINVSTGITKPVLGSPTQPVLDLNSIDVSGATGGTLTIRFSETGFLSTGPSASFLASVGGVTAGSVVFDYYASASNTNFATDIAITSSGLKTGPFSYTGIGSGVLTGNYSLTTVATIVHPGGSTKNSSFNSTLDGLNQTVDIPEAPFAPALFVGALALAGIRILRRRA